MADDSEVPRVVRASCEIAARAEEIFELIANPSDQPRWDGNDNLAEAPPGQRVRNAGGVFVMTLTRGINSNVRENHVVEFEEGRRIAWLPSETGQAPPGHLWRWELEPLDETRTRVTHTYDWSDLTDDQRISRARATTVVSLQASLDNLAELAERASAADLDFYFDPICAWAWIASKWVRTVAEQRGYRVDWRFYSLRLRNADVDYDTHFPDGYEVGHTAGLRLLRVAARVRAEFGRDAVGVLYAAIGRRIFDATPDQALTSPFHGSRAFLEPILREQHLPLELLDALDDVAFDADIQSETNEARALAGADAGTPVLHVRAPNRSAIFGLAITRLPSDEEAGPLWDNLTGLASFAAFAELKRDTGERPQLARSTTTPATSSHPAPACAL